ncbi:hypothetical protein AN958_03357 [Leucoagaricus sp. SymC.cos]|nr:hypothetical protein AN958_03357 [Leucoagaricus sp. SymC.cos]
MICVATVYNNCHWECECERAHTCTTENPPTSSQTHKNPADNSSSNNRPSSTPHSQNKQQSSSTSGPTNTNNKNTNQPPRQQSPAKSSTPTPSTSSSSSQPPAPKKDLSNVLGKDGKLTEAEKQCCIEKNLCGYCSIFSHQVKSCKCKEANQKACGHKAELPTSTSASTPTKSSEK